jgi:hypothetical protein
MPMRMVVIVRMVVVVRVVVVVRRSHAGKLACACDRGQPRRVHVPVLARPR